MTIDRDVPLSLREPHQVLVRDLLTPGFTEAISNDEKVVLTRAWLVVMQYLAKHVNKNIGALYVSDLLELDITQHKDGVCFVTHLHPGRPVMREELSQDAMTALDMINTRLEKRWPNRNEIRLRIHDVE